MKQHIEAPQFGERPDAGLATLALGRFRDGHRQDWQRLPKNVAPHLYDPYLADFVPVSRDQLSIDRSAGNLIATPGGNRPSVTIYGLGAVLFA